MPMVTRKDPRVCDKTYVTNPGCGNHETSELAYPKLISLVNIHSRRYSNVSHLADFEVSTPLTALRRVKAIHTEI